MASMNSSVMFWTEEEIIPRSLLLIASGAAGDRLLLWQSTSSPGSPAQREQSTSGPSFSPRPKIFSCMESTPSVNATQNLTASQQCHRGVSCPSPAGGNLGGHVTVSTSSAVFGSPHQAATPSNEVGISMALGTDKTRLSGTTPKAQRLFPTAASAASSPVTPSAVGNLSQSSASITTAPSEMVIDNVSVTSLLSLLHPSTNELQHKIHVKLSTKVIVGVAFSLTKTVMETHGVSVGNWSSPLINRRGSMPNTISHAPSVSRPLDDYTSIITSLRLKSPSPPPEYQRNQTQVTICGSLLGAISGKHSEKTLNRIISSFTIAFVLDEAAPPCVQSQYTELARLTGVQLRRSELHWQNLSMEREKISAILDQYAGILSSGDSQANTRGLDGNNDIDGIGTANATVGGVDVVSPLIPAHKRASSEAPDESDSTKFDKCEGSGSGCSDPWRVYAHITKCSPLCSELSQILTQVTSSGRVNVKIYKKYEVFFCLPFKTYAIMPFEQKMITMAKTCWPAIRPGSVLRAMRGLRPYHTLLLNMPKHFLLTCSESFPIDANQSLESFADDLSPSSSLASMSNRGHSQENCLRVALWLVYHGYAIIISPIVSSNAYVLAPLSHCWLHPQLILQFAAQFPWLNFAEVLASFSDRYTLDEHLSGRSPFQFWTKLNAIECTDLVGWLLRRRLIVQAHTYIISLLPKTASDVPAEINERMPDSDSSISSESPTESAFIRIHQGCGGSLLRSALPTEANRESVLMHYRSTVQLYPNMLHLFLRLLTRLPAHLEEVMFVESVDRQTLISCMQLFSPFLITMRLPDPVTACFAGLEWPH